MLSGGMVSVAICPPSIFATRHPSSLSRACIPSCLIPSMAHPCLCGKPSFSSPYALTVEAWAPSRSASRPSFRSSSQPPPEYSPSSSSGGVVIQVEKAPSASKPLPRPPLSQTCKKFTILTKPHHKSFELFADPRRELSQKCKRSSVFATCHHKSNGHARNILQLECNGV